MTPDPTSDPVRRVPRGPARLIAGLALVAVTAACGSGGEDASGADRQTASAVPAPTPAASASADPSEPPLDSADSRPVALQGPYTLRIPRIGVDAPVVAITSNQDRELVPPRDPGLAGWWSDGAAPGAPQGSAVLVGHTVRAGGGVFDDVGELHGGDTIEVGGSGRALTYRVQSVDVLSTGDLARNAEDIFTQTGPGRLVVITCDDWDGTRWRSNIVTVAAPA
jgi:LPXTG-site transpeptidase (sortase) family protein